MGSNARPFFFARTIHASGTRLDRRGRPADSKAMTPAQLNDQAWHWLAQGDHPRAAELLRRCLALSPADPDAHVGLASIERQRGALREAILHCDAALAAAPGYAGAWLERAFTLASGGEMAQAVANYARVLALEPGNVHAHAGIASILARDGDSPEARRHARAALAGDPRNVIAAAALATMELESNRPDEALAIVAPLAGDKALTPGDASLVLGLIASAQDRLGEYEAACRAYAASKQAFAAAHAAHFASRPPHRDFVAGLARDIELIAPLSWSAATGDAPNRRHVFVLGYPRSGNTLLENVLASLAGVEALEERPTLREADRAFLATPGGLGKLSQLTETEVAALRRDYWQRVEDAGIAHDVACFVDMDPLKSLRLPLIARLFPEARVLLMRRDPRDVVWSCFRTNFALTNAALDFTTLEGTARHYDATMTLIERAMERLPLNLMVVDYRRLVTDFDATTREICAFAGLEWSADLRRFDRTAQRRGVSTASAGQVRRGLYDGGGQWRPYARWLEPVMPLLQPWVEKFGYADR